jgi:hypothetical protein
MVQLSWNTISPEVKSEVFMQSTVEPNVVAGLVAISATGMDAVVMDVPDKADVPVTLSMVLTYQTPTAILRHKNGRP